MAVLITAENQGQTQQGYDGMLGVLADSIKQAPGFILHTAHPVEGGWRVIEVWESKDDANRFLQNTWPLTYRRESGQSAHFRNYTA